MRATRKKKQSPEFSQKLAPQAQNLRNIVLEYRELLRQEFSDERRQDIKDDFTRLAVDPAIEIVEGISAMDDVPQSERAHALKVLYNVLVKQLEILDVPQVASVKWEDRGKKNWRMNPCNFVVDNYPGYGNGLTMAHISSHDEKLYAALIRAKREGNWPTWFYLDTQSEANDRVLAEIGHIPTMSEIASKVPPHIRELIRIHELHRSRRAGSNRMAKHRNMKQ